MTDLQNTLSDIENRLQARLDSLSKRQMAVLNEEAEYFLASTASRLLVYCQKINREEFLIEMLDHMDYNADFARHVYDLAEVVAYLRLTKVAARFMDPDLEPRRAQKAEDLKSTEG